MRQPATRKGTEVLAILLLAAAGCSKEQPPADTSSTVAVQGDSVEAPAAPQPESRIGRLPMFSALAPDGTCQVRRFEGVTAALAAELTFEESLPVRVIKVAVAPETRSFRIVSVDISVRRGVGVGSDENETLLAAFDGAGNVQEGNRQYFTSDNNVRERQALMFGDPVGESAKQVGLQVMQRCMTSGA